MRTALRVSVVAAMALYTFVRLLSDLKGWPLKDSDSGLTMILIVMLVFAQTSTKPLWPTQALPKWQVFVALVFILVGVVMLRAGARLVSVRLEHDALLVVITVSAFLQLVLDRSPRRTDGVPDRRGR